MRSKVFSAGAIGRGAEPSELDQLLDELADRALEFARLRPGKKAELVRRCLANVRGLTEGWVEQATIAKGLPSEQAAEEWEEPWILMRALRLLAESLEAIELYGKPPLGRSSAVRDDGRLVVEVMPCSEYDRVAYFGYQAQVLFRQGLDVAGARAEQAIFYASAHDQGRVALVLGAGNRSVIAALDALHKLFTDGEVCLIKINPVAEWAGPVLEQVLAPLTEAGFVRFAYGGSDVGAYLCEHPRVDTLHMTGSRETHDAIVWGPPGAERERRLASNDQKNARPFTSELGNVSAVAVVPAEYSDKELDAQVRILVTSVVNNASFNCNATKLLVLARGWRQRAVFLERLVAALGDVPARPAYYPGALERYERLTKGRAARVLGSASRVGSLPWTVMFDLDPDAHDELFVTEPFCGILSEVSLDVRDPGEFLADVTVWLNTRVEGTLNVGLVCPPKLERDPSFAAALDRAVLGLKYGCVAINTWPAVGFGLPSLPWGGYPGRMAEDVQSGRGFVHNTYLLGGIEKVVVRCPIVPRPLPPWVHGHPKAAAFIKAFLAYEAAPAMGTVLGLARHAV